MDSSDVCPNCGRYFLRSEIYRCPTSKEEMNYLIDDNEDSIPFLDKVVEESKSYEESANRSVSTAHNFNVLEENTLEQTEGEYESSNLNLLKENPFIGEGNLDSPLNEEIFTGENQEEAVEPHRRSGENSENTIEFLFIDTSLQSEESVPMVSQHGNPLDGLPFTPVFTVNSSDSYQEKDQTLKSAVACKRHSTSTDAVTTNVDPDLRLNQSNIRKPVSEDVSSYSNMCLLRESIEHQNASKDASVTLPSHSQVVTSRLKKRSVYLRSESEKLSQREGFPCNPCRQVFLSKKLYTGHMKRHHNTSEESSVALPKSIQSGTSRLDHSRHSRTEIKKSPLKHSPEKSFTCEKCGQTFLSKRNYDIHMLLHSNRKPFACKECGRGFDTESELKNHCRNQTGEVSFECCVCGRKFSKNRYLKSHFRVHTGERPYKCPWCDRAFSQRGSRNKHRRSHTE